MRGTLRVMILQGVAALVLGLTATPAGAHDFWLEFGPLAPQPGAELSLSLWVGEDFAAHEQKPMDLARTVALRHVTASGDEDLRGAARDGAVPMHRLTLAQPGGHLLAIERSPARIELRARKFNRYLKHEGLGAVLAERKRSGERLRRGRERYSRYLKAFVQVGAAADGVSMRVLGHRIELVPERDLATLRAGERLVMQVRFDGAPLAGAQVEAFVRGPSGAPVGQMVTSDATGRVTFAVDRGGAWLVRTVHMQRCTGCEDAQWESFWTGYSFAAQGPS